MITSFIEGRVRIRHEALTDAEKSSMVVGMLRDYPGIQSVQANTLTGSILVHYDPAQIDQEQLAQAEQMLSSFCGEESTTRSDLTRWIKKLTSRQVERKLLNVTLALCLAGIFGYWRLHVVAGTAFSALCVGHSLRRRPS